MTPEPFAVVWCPEGGEPTVQHATHTAAAAEAERLARANPGKRFFVLIATDRFVRDEVRHDRLQLIDAVLTDDMIPF